MNMYTVQDIKQHKTVDYSTAYIALP